ncbi:transposase family protein [Veillonella sp. R32]|uniref:transposase family protein n=1 Tax=Veillonella sp. R32 TaxID=2021312 RepID=UPI0013894AD2|nr:transposase family protein [Veillonella sp. R32]KAF1682592.1 hypothetical protein VER_05140 [Veillonella sp. R32]
MVDLSKGNYKQKGELTDLFNISRSTVQRYVERMVKIPKYKEAVTRLSHKLVLVNVDMFAKFISELDKGYYRNEKTA